MIANTTHRLCKSARVVKQSCIKVLILNAGFSLLTFEQKQNLAESAAEIQQLLKQLSNTYPTTTNAEKMAVVAEAAERIEKNPNLNARVINALKAAGTEAFKKAIDHPLVNILVATIERWHEAE